MRQEGERGFALLLVFAMAAAVAILLYSELPRAMFESQRAKEQLLVERGEQYQRAIGLFVKKFQRYPAALKDLEETNNIRFLRKRFKDPMTGKDEWR
ncbi:MAG TPA: type II secretion system protein, partial [Solibacterales bacterium]|nr:type II secretion system protein [Bryobacterales bacterium]